MEGTDPSAVDPILDAAKPLYEPTEQALVITSAADGKHSTGSLHYSGEALDLRIWNLPTPAQVAERLQQELGPDYDVVHHEGSHIHVEYDPA
ncbi:hypothetical protein GGP85_002919 [Salinibacter ruber]|uniref:hypothetical protein n=1 Tax=Salinibacter ruber TaxID=146919 RepID=UPI002166DFBB|nr:hypothetical protein [Salinibacter ruber]MCS3827449.1 hypothetical protein [Salinibacter ruber]